MNTEKLEFEVKGSFFKVTGVEVLGGSQVMYTIKNLNTRVYKSIKKQSLKKIIEENNLNILKKALYL